VTVRRTIRLPAWVEHFDESVDRAWEPLRSDRTSNAVFYAASAAGDFSVIWHGINLARVAAGAADRREAARLAIALGLESVLVNQVLKRLFARERPVATTPRPHHLRAPSTSSFPSGHASSGALAASLLSQGSRLAPVYGTIAAVVATSRIHVRIHHASDIVAGAAVGLAMGAVVRKVAPRR
jgi:undecaprenyl-diphosphatase